MAIRDIRSDLSSRLADAEKKRQTLAEESRLNDRDIESLKHLIEMENRRVGPETEGKHPVQEELALDLPAFIKSITKIKPMTKTEMARQATAKNYFDEGVSPGRVVHFTVMNMLKRKELQIVGDKEAEAEEKKYTAL